jgi:hypothetical protein
VEIHRWNIITNNAGVPVLFTNNNVIDCTWLKSHAFE